VPKTSLKNPEYSNNYMPTNVKSLYCEAKYIYSIPSIAI